MLQVECKASEDIATRIAIDQSNKINEQVSRNVCKRANVKYAKWNHIAGKYSSRPEHVAFDGKVFELEKGMWSPSKGEYIFPGQEVYCRCTYTPLPRYVEGS